MDETLFGTHQNDGTPQGLGEIDNGSVNPVQQSVPGVQIPTQPVPQPQATQPAAQPQVSELPPALAQLGLEPAVIDALVEYAFGIPRQTVRSNFEYVQARQREEAISPLRNEWGDSFEQNFGLVQERFNQLPPHKQAIYDNVDGAKFIWQQIQAEQAQQAQAAQVPTFDRGRANGTPNAATGRYKYTMSQINAMSSADYAKVAADIQAAFGAGLVDTRN